MLVAGECIVLREFSLDDVHFLLRNKYINAHSASMLCPLVEEKHTFSFEVQTEIDPAFEMLCVRTCMHVHSCSFLENGHSRKLSHNSKLYSKRKKENFTDKECLWH
jgi:hypothetical protein